MKIYNPISKTAEDFVPSGDVVTVYVCGITPYDTTHLGHAFTYVIADTLIRYYEYKGHQVSYVQNVTDIDDDILRKAREVGEDWKALGDRWTAHFIRDMIALNVRSPDFFPRATEVIPEITEMVQQLVEKGHAYHKNGNVYFDVNSWDSFGELSHLSKEDMLPVANERGNNPDDPNKRHPLDFVLWQAQAPDEPAWESPWGPGRPGWHIECSAMSTKYLGNTIDFHSGGGDLCFPHHECEIAQVEPITGEKPFVKFWMHAAMVRHQGEKMSKSLGNLVWVRDLLKTHTPDSLRIYLGMNHYQIEWSCDYGRLEWSDRLAKRFKRTVNSTGGNKGSLDPAPFQERFNDAMDDNLNTPAALSAVDDLSVEILLSAQAGWDVSKAQQVFKMMTKVFGLQLGSEEPEARVQKGWNLHLQKFISLD